MPDPDPLPATDGIRQVAMLTADAALRLVQAAAAHARTNDWAVAVAVADPAGQIVAAWRLDGATPPIAEFAADKAFTAATMRRSTAAFAARMDSSPALRLGLATRNRLLAWGGGLPVVYRGQVVGGIGVSGAADADDIACAEAALTAEGFGWHL